MHSHDLRDTGCVLLDRCCSYRRRRFSVLDCSSGVEVPVPLPLWTGVSRLRYTQSDASWHYSVVRVARRLVHSRVDVFAYPNHGRYLGIGCAGTLGDWDLGLQGAMLPCLY